MALLCHPGPRRSGRAGKEMKVKILQTFKPGAIWPVPARTAAATPPRPVRLFRPTHGAFSDRGLNLILVDKLVAGAVMRRPQIPT